MDRGLMRHGLRELSVVVSDGAPAAWGLWPSVVRRPGTVHRRRKVLAETARAAPIAPASAGTPSGGAR